MPRLPRVGGRAGPTTGLRAASLAVDLPVGDNSDYVAAFNDLLQSARTELYSRARSEGWSGALSDSVVESCVYDLKTRYQRICTRSMLLELRIAGVLGELAGDDPQSRYRSFIVGQQSVAARMALSQRYPLLDSALREQARQWLSSCSLVLRSISKDHRTLNRRLGLALSPDRIVSVSFGLGDLHRRGRSVAVVTDELGERVVFKPRSFEVDSFLRSVASILGDNLGGEPFRVPRFVRAGKRRGWAAFIEPKECAQPADVCAFFRRQGNLLAVASVLGSADLHSENLIASEGFPYIVDAETILHPRLGDAQESPDAHRLFNSLLLPMAQAVFRGRPIADISGIAGRGGASWQEQPHVVDGGTDHPHLEWIRTEQAPASNMPILNGKQVDPAPFAQYVAEGFEECWTALGRSAPRLRTLLDQFRNSPIRVVPRATSYYGSLIGSLAHPDAMQDPVEFELVLQDLWRDVERRPALRGYIESEKRQLRIRNIPYYESTIGDTEVRDDRGRVCQHVIASAGADCLTRLSKITESTEQLAHYRWLINASLGISQPTPFVDQGPEEDIWLRGESLVTSAVQRIVEREARTLQSIAARVGDEYSWLTRRASLNDPREWIIRPPDASLYDGELGVGLFLTAAGEYCDDDDLKAVGRNVLRRALVRAGDGDCGLYSGAGGWIALRGYLEQYDVGTSSAWDSVARRVLAAVDLEAPLGDFVGGIAGLLVAGCYALGTSPLVDSVVERTIPKLADAVEVWLRDDQVLGGLSHGLAGLGCALVMGFEMTGRRSLAELAEVVYARQELLWSDEHQGWRDLRYDEGAEGDPYSMNAWCHGGPGIVLAKCAAAIRGTVAIDPARLELQIDAAFKLPPINASLCHGYIGNLCLLHRIASSGAVAAGTQLRQYERRCLERLASGPGVSADDIAADNPSIMTGRIGTAYGLMLVAGGDIPDILSWNLLQDGGAQSGPRHG
ncbi:MAG: type 2 lanthipeptide synthetase LanM family protein [Ilumatobacteraceae bacterium]